jgi:predicted HAD superfamily Cof-like phosphohydrolase
MTAATNKALELYPEPEGWIPTQGARTERMTDDQRKAHNRALMLRSTLMSDEWPRMVRAFSMVMRLPIPTDVQPLDPATLAEHVNRLMREVGDLASATTVIKQADEAFDVIYLATRLLVALGLTDTQILAGFTECHASNMTKVQDNGEPLINDGVIRPDEPIGKALKTNNYVPPDYETAMSLEKGDA